MGKRANLKADAMPTIQLKPEPDETREQAIARFALDPRLGAGGLLSELYKYLPNVDLTSFIAELGAHAKAVSTGDLSQLEGMLTAQTHSLNGLFYALAQRSRDNSKEGFLDASETYMKLALRAQNQCRASVETLANMKSPPTVFARQANIAHGPQQVNNGVAPQSQSSRAREIENAPTKLLEADRGERMDTRAPSTAKGADQELEAVGAIHRPKDFGGKGNG